MGYFEVITNDAAEKKICLLYIDEEKAVKLLHAVLNIVAFCMCINLRCVQLIMHIYWCLVYGLRVGICTYNVERAELHSVYAR